MARSVCVILPILAISFLVVGIKADDPATEEADNVIVRAVVESCGGWRLNRLPEVKRFIYEDIPLYHNVEFVRKPGAPPILMLKNNDGKDVEKIQLQDYNREQCNDLLLSRGFYKKKNPSDEVPEEYKNAPLKQRVKEEL